MQMHSIQKKNLQIKLLASLTTCSIDHNDKLVWKKNLAIDHSNGFGTNKEIQTLKWETQSTNSNILCIQITRSK